MKLCGEWNNGSGSRAKKEKTRSAHNRKKAASILRIGKYD